MLKTATPGRAPSRVPRFSISRRTRAFRRALFPEAGDRDWNDWRWQLRHSLRGLEALERVLDLSDDERSALQRNRNSLPNSITPYYASLLDRSDASHPLRRTMVMATQEFERTPEESIDPLSEDADSPVPGLVHRYPDRVPLPRHRNLPGVLPVLHTLAHGRLAGRRLRIQHRPVGARD